MMERNRESRRSSSISNGFPKRRHRASVLRDSSEERAAVEASSKRGRDRDRERERDSSNRSKRRRSFHSQTTEEDSTGEDEQDDDVQDAGISFTRSVKTTSSPSISDQNHRRSFTPARPPPPLFKAAGEVIGVTVPRKARSASVRRSPASGGGGGEERNFRQRSNSPKAIGAVTDTSKSGSSDMDIEMAELLFGLKTSNNHERKDAEEKKVEDYNSIAELVRSRNEKTEDLDSHENGSSEAQKKDSEEEKLKSNVGCDGVTTEGRSVSPNRESPSCSKLDVDKQDSASARVMRDVPEADNRRASKFEIDLMAPPSSIISPEGDYLSRDDFMSKIKALAHDGEMKRGDDIKVEDKVEIPGEIEKTEEEIKEAKAFDFKEKKDVPNHDLEKPNSDNNDIKTNVKSDEQDRRNKEQPTKLSNSRMEKSAQSCSVPVSTAVSGQPSSLSSIGYMSQTGVKMDKTTGSSTAMQHVNFVLSQPQPKRCATHHYIARNIFLHQKLTKATPHLPAAVGSASLCGTDSNNVPSNTESMFVRKQSSKHLQDVKESTQEKGWATATSDPCLTATRSSNHANLMDSAQRMQLVLQQGPHPGSTGNLVPGPAFLFPPGQHQASVATATSQAKGANSISSASYSKSHSSAAGSLGNSSTLPAAAASMSFRYPKISASDTPYVTIVQNNGYSFPISTSLGANAMIRGTNPPQATPVLSGPFYPSQIFHPLQHPQQHLHSQALAQPNYLTASTSSGSSSHKQSQGAQVNGNNILTSTTAQPQQLQKQQNSLSHSRRYGTEMSGENTSSVANRTSYPPKNVHGHNYTLPVQPANLSFRPSATSDNVGGNGENFGDKQPQQQASKGGVEAVPSQAFAISFAAFNGTNVPSNLNFASMTQNPVIFQSLPNIAWQGYQAASSSLTTQQKTNSITEGKSGSNSSHQDDEKKTTHGKSSTNGPTTLVFDNSAKNLNFMLSPVNGNWPSHSTASTAITSVPLSNSASNSQHPSQLLQLQKQHQHGSQQQQPAMATLHKASSAKATTTKFAANAPVFSQTVTQTKSSGQGSHSKSSSGRTADSHVHQTSGITSNTPTLKSFSQDQGRVSQGHMQISFAGNYISSLPPQGQQQLLNENQPLCSKVNGTPLNGGNVKPNSEGRKVRQ